MSNGFLLDRDSIAALARLLRERGIGNQTIERNIVDTWPTCHPARVTEAITARDEDVPGKGKVKLLISDQVTGDAETQNIKLIAGDDTEDQTVYRISKSTDEIAVDDEGYVIQDRTGKLWWVESKVTKLVRFTLTAALAASGTAAATIVSSGADNGTTITVSDHAGNAAESGDSGIAWKDGTTYWVIEIKAAADEGDGAVTLVRFTLDEDIDPTSHLAGATINGGVDDGETIEVEDWQYNGGRSGDQGIAWKDGTDYYIIEIKQSPIVRFTLTSALGRDRGDSASAEIERDIVGTPTTGTVNAWTKGPGAIEGARGTAFRLQLGDEVEYWIQSVEPRATRIRGRVSADFETTDTTLSVDGLVGLNGDVDDSFVEAQNIHEWAGKVDDKVRLEWNQEDSQWEAYQIDCTEEGTPS